jgi:hypothetical protein
LHTPHAGWCASQPSAATSCRLARQNSSASMQPAPGPATTATPGVTVVRSREHAVCRETRDEGHCRLAAASPIACPQLLPPCRLLSVAPASLSSCPPLPTCWWCHAAAACWSSPRPRPSAKPTVSRSSPKLAYISDQWTVRVLDRFVMQSITLNGWAREWLFICSWVAGFWISS